MQKHLATHGVKYSNYQIARNCYITHFKLDSFLDIILCYALKNSLIAQK